MIFGTIEIKGGASLGETMRSPDTLNKFLNTRYEELRIGPMD